MRVFLALLTLSVCMSACNSNDPLSDPLRRQNQIAEYIERRASESLFQPEPPRLLLAPSYAWEAGHSNQLPKITKEYFRCRGSEFNPMRVLANASTGPVYLHDCAGTERHSLPLRNNEEFVYPVLIDLLNHLQLKTGKLVVITSGHRCPAHNSYVDESKENSSSKHLLGAAVTFYIQGMEDQPEAVIEQLMSYYTAGPKDLTTFTRDSSAKQASSTPAWLNKEIAMRLFRAAEGRNFDNRHPYPYICLTVRYDRDLQEKVTYSWDKAQRNFLRW